MKNELCMNCFNVKGVEEVCPHCGYIEGTPPRRFIWNLERSLPIVILLVPALVLAVLVSPTKHMIPCWA